MFLIAKQTICFSRSVFVKVYVYFLQKNPYIVLCNLQAEDHHHQVQTVQCCQQEQRQPAMYVLPNPPVQTLVVNPRIPVYVVLAAQGVQYGSIPCQQVLTSHHLTQLQGHIWAVLRKRLDIQRQNILLYLLYSVNFTIQYL